MDVVLAHTRHCALRLGTVSIIRVNLSDTHSLRSRYGQCGRRAWRGPGGSPRAVSGFSCSQLLRGPPLFPPPT
eukprot:scaffold134112_cov75-Phaeocystis_antarctica.AAC.1